MSYICASETFILHLLFGLLWFLNYIILWFNAAKLSIAATSKLTESNTCTNATLVCPLCRDGADAIWKYSLWLLIHILNKSIIQLTFSNTRIYTILCQSIEWQVANCSTLFTQSWREDIWTIPIIHSHCTSVKKLWAPKILVSFWVGLSTVPYTATAVQNTVPYGYWPYRNRAILSKSRHTTVRWRLQTAVLRRFTVLRSENFIQMLYTKLYFIDDHINLYLTSANHVKCLG